MSAYEELMAWERETQALDMVIARLGWDQETVMPRGAGERRGDELAALSAVLHGRRIDPRIGEWLAAAAPADEAGKRAVALIARSYERSMKIPAELEAELARVTSRAQGQWAEARANEDVAAFVPVLAQVLKLKREEAAALADGGDLYDALLDDYEPGAKAADLEEMFGALRPRLVALRERILGAERQPQALSGHYPEAGQMALSTKLAEAFGYDFNRGRIDKAVHPFCSGSGVDVRITTRVAEDDPFNCFYSTIHEVGHACYEQGIDEAYGLTPMGAGVSMAVHESQSRIYENQMGRGRAFIGWLYDQMVEAFGSISVTDAEAFYAAVNKVKPGYIRTEADEVQYNLHVLMRFDLEREMVAGRLEARDLEEAWNARFEQDFGYGVDKPSNGCLQDVHWSAGLFGYFPTYSLGNVYAGCLNKALRAQVSGVDEGLARGDARPATEWLRENLQRHGGLREPKATVEAACGFAPSEGPLLDYLEEKFGGIYGV